MSWVFLNRLSSAAAGELMQQPFEEGIPEHASAHRHRAVSWVLLAAGAAAAILMAVVLWPAPAGRRAAATFGPAEQAHARKIRIQNLALSQAESFLNQQVTTISGDLTNDEERAVRDIELTIEFTDPFGQVVLRETRAAFSSADSPLGPGEQRNFQVAFEHLPSSWNVQQPVVQVTALRFASNKK